MFSVISLVVLRDSFKNQTDEDEKQFTTQKESQVQRKVRSFSGLRGTPPDRETEKYEKATHSPKKPADLQTTEKKTEIVTAKAKPLKKVISFRVTMINRKAIEDLMENGQKLEDNAFIIETRLFNQTINQSTLKPEALGYINTHYQFNQEIPMFIGEEDPETSSNIGFYLQVNVLENSRSEEIHFGVQSWYQLKTNDFGPRREWDTTMNNSSSLIITHPEIHDISFSQEDFQLFESSQKLKPLGNENFQEDHDIVFVLEVR